MHHRCANTLCSESSDVISFCCNNICKIGMTKLITEDLCYVSDIETAAAISGDSFAIVSCEWYASCAGKTQFVDPASGAILDVRYCKTNPIYLGVLLALVLVGIIVAVVFYFKNRGTFDNFMKKAQKPPIEEYMGEDEDDEEY